MAASLASKLLGSPPSALGGVWVWPPGGGEGSDGRAPLIPSDLVRGLQHSGSGARPPPPPPVKHSGRGACDTKNPLSTKPGHTKHAIRICSISVSVLYLLPLPIPVRQQSALFRTLLPFIV
jgi:hypothetical protein